MPGTVAETLVAADESQGSPSISLGERPDGSSPQPFPLWPGKMPAASVAGNTRSVTKPRLLIESKSQLSSVAHVVALCSSTSLVEAGDRRANASNLAPAATIT